MSAALPSAPSSLRALIEVTLAHEYLDGPFDQFTTVPLPATSRQCRDLGLQVLQSGASLKVFARCQPSRWSALSAQRAALAKRTFCWQITPVLPEFAAVTDLELRAMRQQLVLTPASPLPTGGTLTAESRASERDLWDWRPLAFDYQPATPLEAGSTLALTTALGTVVATSTVGDPQRIAIDLTPFGSGLYRLVQSGQVLDRWFADERGATGAGTGPSVILVLDGALLAAALQKATSGSADAAPVTYTGTFPAREVTWRYHVFNASPDEVLQVASLDEAMDDGGRRGRSGTTEPFYAIEVPEYPTAMSFESVAAYKLVQRPHQRFALLSAGQPRVAPLPVAAPGFASRGQNAGFCSDIFIHL